MEHPNASAPKKDFSLDESTLEQVCLRQTDALNKFFDHFYERVYGYLAVLLRNRVLAEDLTQDAFLRIHRGIHRLDPHRDPTGWVFTVVTNTVRDYWRSKEHKAATKQTTLDEPEDSPLTDTTPTADTTLEQQETAQAIGRALVELSETDREVILLRNYEELDTAIIASMLNVTPEAVRQRHSRALARLSQAFLKMKGKDQKEP
jgi:RNA polymerase sigma-70 factor (ECF subfamily)